MGDSKTSGLIELPEAGLTDADLLMIVNAGQSKKFTIASLFTRIGSSIDSAIEAFKAGFGVLNLIAVSQIDNIIGTVYSTIELVNSVALDKNNDHITHDFLTNKCTINTTGTYSFAVFGTFLAPQNESITFAWYINGGATTSEVEFLGNGAKPVPISGAMLKELNAGDYVEVKAKAATAAITLSIVSASYVIEKTHHD